MMTIRVTAMAILERHHVKPDCYRNDKKNWALKDVKEVYPDGENGFTAGQIACELQRIGDEQPYDGPIPYGTCEETELYDGMDVGRWGITDMRLEARDKLAELLASGEMFDTGWLSSSKCEDCARITADEHHVWVEAGTSIDSIDMGDYAILTDCCDDEEENDFWELLTDEERETLAEDAIMCYGYEETRMANPVSLPRTASVDDVLLTIEKMTDETEREQHETFSHIREMVKFYIKWVRDGRKDLFEGVKW